MVVDLTQLAKMFGALEPQARPPPHVQIDGVVLGHADDGAACYWPRPVQQSAGHGLVLAASGAGKTVMVADVLARELVEEQRRPARLRSSLIVLDPKGDLAHHLVQAVSATSPSALAHVTILDPFSRDGFAFNLNLSKSSVPMDIRALQLAELVAEVSTGIGGAKAGMGTRQVDVLQHALLGALAVPTLGASPLLALDALIEREGFAALAELTTSDRARQFLENTKLAPELQSSTSSRLRMALATTDQLERLVAAPACIDMEALLGPGNIVVIDLGHPPGGLKALTTFWANLLLRQFVDQLLVRPTPWHGHHTRLVIDEAHIVSPVLSDVAEVILTTGRSRGLSLVTMTQTLSLLQRSSAELVRCLEANVPFKLAGRLAPTDADLLARGAGVNGSARERLVHAVVNLPDRYFVCLQPGAVAKLKSREVQIRSWRDAERRSAQDIAAARSRFAVPAAAPRRTQLRDLAGERHAETAPRPRDRSGRAPRSRWG